MPNNRFTESFEYGYTGFSIYYVNGKIIVDDVIKDSPSDIAGFKIEDEIISVGSNISRNIQQIKDMLQEPNTKLSGYNKKKRSSS